jgi:hypothetical protein
VNAALKHLGLVSGAVFTDLTGDGRPELVLACEWGPVRVFEFEGKSIREVTEARGLANYLGLWNSVTAGDFDEDGRLDLVAGNWGLNCAYHQVAPGPWHLYFGDLNGDGSVHVLEAYHDAAMNQIVPWRDLQFLEPDLPWLRERFPTHKAYSLASVPDILGERAKTVQRLTINTLESMVFLNRGDHFEARPLPVEAQWSPAMGLAVGDLDGDGHEDLFISQNFFGVRPEEGRLDAGRGLWLQGDGQGSFRPVPGQESGIKVYEEQRGCAVADYDADGRLDLVVTQNNAETKLYHNVRARPGLRVRLRGPTHNPEGIGAVLQLKRGERWGPAREVRAGGGYWSQDSAEQVLALPESAPVLRVRWPGGKVTESPIPPQSKAVWVDSEGHVESRP